MNTSVVRASHYRLLVAAVAIALFLVGFSVRYLSMAQPLTEYPSGRTGGFDLQLYCYEGFLVAAGANPFDLADQPQFRNSILDEYAASNPPLNFLLFGGIVGIHNLIFDEALHHHCISVVHAFAAFDSLVGVAIFLCLVWLLGVRVLPALLAATLWYGLNGAPIVANIVTIEDKPFYTILLVIFVSLLLRFERRFDQLDDRQKKRSIIWLSILLGFITGFKLLTLYTIPVWLAFLHARQRSWRHTAFSAVIAGSVIFASFLPFFPDSYGVLLNRLERAEVAPFHASIFRILPFFGNLTVILSLGSIAILTVLVYKRKISLALAAALTMFVGTVITTDGSLDRSLTGLIPLVVYLAARVPWQAVIYGAANWILAFLIVFLVRNPLTPMFDGLRSRLVRPGGILHTGASDPEFLDAVYVLITVFLLAVPFVWIVIKRRATSLKTSLR